MSIPDYQSLMLPLLKLTLDGQEHHFPDLLNALAAEYKLTDSETRELLPSGSQFLFANRVGWARTYMKKAGLLSAEARSGSNYRTRQAGAQEESRPDRQYGPPAVS
jgi:restriction system protein